MSESSVDELVEVVEQADDPGLKHYYCEQRYRNESGQRVAICGVILDGAHICPRDMSCGCILCPDCDAMSGPNCPVLGGPCIC
ncbi:MAG: hypothetical protein WCK41_00375 [Actinomycetes bacterium]